LNRPPVDYANVDRLKGLHANDFPVTVDPTVVFYANPWTAFASNGYSCSYPCLTRVGNSQYLGDLYWHTLAYFPYESLIDNGQKVVSANVNFSRTAGTSNGNPIDVCWAAAWSYDGACGTGLHGYWGSGTLNDTLDVDVTGLYAYWVDNSIRGGSLGITGNEQSGLFTYKELWDSVTVVYNTPPPVPTPTAPAVDAVVSTLTPTFAVNPVTDADGDAVAYGFIISTGADGLSGQVVGSSLVGSTWTEVVKNFV
jgi:hypothetical protein